MTGSLLLVLCAVPAAAQHIESVGAPLPAEALVHINTETAEIADTADARAILEATLFGPGGNAGGSLDDPNVYCVIHVMKWMSAENTGPTAAAGNDRKKEPAPKQQWYVYHAGRRWSPADFATNRRVFGVKKLWLVFIHLDRPPEQYRSRYQFSVAAKTPAPLANLAGLATFYFSSKAGGSVQPHRWGGGAVDIASVPSDISIQPIRIKESATQNVFEKIGDPQVFDNEGRYRLDFSVGVPIKAGKELKVDAAAAAASPAKVDKQNIFALINVFLTPVDVKSSGLRRVPHLLLGAAITEKPQDKLLVAAGWGPAFANFYAGALFVKQPVADAAGARWDPQFAFGINLTYRGTKAALEAAAK